MNTNVVVSEIGLNTPPPPHTHTHLLHSKQTRDCANGTETFTLDLHTSRIYMDTYIPYSIHAYSTYKYIYIHAYKYIYIAISYNLTITHYELKGKNKTNN